jgi:hypothetical protein
MFDQIEREDGDEKIKIRWEGKMVFVPPRKLSHPC